MFRMKTEAHELRDSKTKLKFLRFIMFTTTVAYIAPL